MIFFTQLVLTLWPLYQLSQLPDSIKLYLLDPIILITLVLQIKRLKFTHPLFKPVSFFLFTALISLLTVIISRPISLLAPFYLIRLALYCSLLLIPLPKNSLKLLRVSFFLIPTLGILQYLFFPDLRFLKTIGYDDHYFRLTFPFLDPNYSGAVLSFIILYSIKGVKNTSNKILICLSLAALALTFSRISWLSFLAGSLYLIYKVRKLRFLMIYSFLILSLFVFVSPKPFGEGVNVARTFSLYSRLNNYKLGWNLFVKNPFTGAGFNTLNVQTLSSPWPHRSSAGLDNSFLFILATSGMLGFFAFLFFLYKSSKLIKDPHLKAAFFSLLIHSFANNTLFYAPITILCLLFLNLQRR